MSTVIPSTSHTSKKKNKSKKLKDGTKTMKAVKSKKTASVCSLHASEVEDLEPISKRFDIFKDQHLVRKFLSVPMSNNQKGRIRQVMKESLQGTSDALLPDIINMKIQALVANNHNISETDLRKVRILYNMLRTAIARNEAKKQLDVIMNKMNGEEVKPKLKRKLEGKDKKNKKAENVVTGAGDNDRNDTEIKVIKHADKSKLRPTASLYKLKPGIDKIKQLDSKINKIKHEESKSKARSDNIKPSKLSEEHKMTEADVPQEKLPKVAKKKKVKRYVVFVGNLPRDITQDQLKSHFREISPLIKHIRIPKTRNEAKRPFAYIELENEPSYESKSAKLQALIKSGKLVGSVPIEKKRSFRRKKKKLAEQQQGL